MPLTNPNAATQSRNESSVGTRNQNVYWAMSKELRLTRKNDKRRPKTCATQPPIRLPTMPVKARACPTWAFRNGLGGLAAAPAASDQGTIQLAVPQPPIIGIVANTIPRI